VSFVSSGAVELCGSSVMGAVEQSREQWDVEGAVDVEGAAYAAGEVFTFEVMWIYIMVFRYRIYIMVFRYL